MNAADLLRRLPDQRLWSNQIVHVQSIGSREARFADLSQPLPPELHGALRQSGIERLYSHQVSAVEAARAGADVVIVTGTASGKTLCYNLPVLSAIAAEPDSTALYLYPTKALTQDQHRALQALQSGAPGISALSGTFDGDTPTALRRKLRDNANVLLTNPDMLHQGVLPHHARWSRFVSRLRYIVIDELHAYRGVFGSHLANVVRRLQRICAHYGAQPTFICSSATIANPVEHAARIIGRIPKLVDNDGSPRGPKQFVLWNPPLIGDDPEAPGQAPLAGGDRRSSLREAVQLLAMLVRNGIQTIAFVRTRLAAEIMMRDTREALRPVSRRLAEAVHAYRGGYLPDERREIERRLADREILGVASTNALELGIDIGSLDACIIVGYPGTVASLWQQAGRSGRGREDSLVFLVAQNSPIDQYLVTHTAYLFGRSPEQAVVDPDNPHIVLGHLRCAAHELPVTAQHATAFGEYAPVLLELLEEDDCVKKIGEQWYWARSEYPASAVSLRAMGGPVYTIQESGSPPRVIGTADEMTALTQLFDHAVYLHGSETYLVMLLDTTQKIVNVERKDLDYYTQSIQFAQIRIDERAEESSWRGCASGFGDVTVTTSIPMFKKIRFHSRDSLGFEALQLPPVQLETVALWLAPPPPVVQDMQARGLSTGEALAGFANVMVEVAPAFVMCDPSDVGATVDASALGLDALFLYDRYPGGMGFARRCLDCLDDIMQMVATVVRNCACENGCPSCVGSAMPAFAATDLDSTVRGRLLDRGAALALLELIGCPSLDRGRPPEAPRSTEVQYALLSSEDDHAAP